LKEKEMTISRLLHYRFGTAVLLLALISLTGCGSPEERAQGYYKSGMALIEKKDDYTARRELLNAVKYKSDKVEVWKALAGIDERTDAQQALFRDLRRIVELDPKDLDARLKLARMLTIGGAPDAALKIMEVASEGEQPSATFHAVKAIILARTNDPAGAIREAQRAYEIDPNNIDAVSILVSKKVADRDPDGALKLLGSLHTDSAKDETRIELEKIQILARKGDLAGAEKLLRDVLAKNPNQPAYHSQLIQILIAQRRFDEAEKELRARVAAEPADSKIGLDLVRFLNAVKGPDAARNELDARVKAGGDVFDYQIALADLDVTQGRSDDALKLLQTLVGSETNATRKSTEQTRMAEIYLSKSNVAAAEPLITEILTADRRNSGALRLRAMIKIGKGNFDGAISDLREALNDQPKSPNLLVLLATAYEKSGKNELADRQYADAVKFSNLNPGVTLQYIAFLQRRAEPARAEEVLSEAATRNPNNLQILSALAQVRLSQKKWAGALRVADTVGQSDANRGLADQIRAAALAGQNKLDQSIAALEDAHKASPDAMQPVASLASAYVAQGQSDKAEALLQDLNKKYPANAQILVLMGQVKLAQKKDDEAIQEFKAAVAQQPKDPVGYGALSDLYTLQKNYEAAGNVIQAGLKEQPENLNFRLALAGLQIQKGDQDAAIAQYDAILKDQPNSLVAINNYVSLVLDHRSDKESLNRAFNLSDSLKNSNVPQFQDTFGWAQYRRGDYKDSVATLESVVAKLPNLAAAHYHLGMAYAAVGQSDKATEQLKSAFALEPDGTDLKESIRSAMK
jgi:predicted Zn-dependent protease